MTGAFHENSRRKAWVIGESSGLQGEQITGNLNIRQFLEHTKSSNVKSFFMKK